MNICDPLFATAASRPEQPALIDGELEWDWRELAHEIGRWSAALAAAGLGRGDRVGICLRDSADFVLALFGAAHRGITYVPLDWRSPAAEIERLAADFDLSLVLREPGSRDIGSARSQVVDERWRDQVATCSPAGQPVEPDNLPLCLGLSSGTTGRAKGAIITHAAMLGRVEKSLEGLGDFRGCRYLSALPLCFGGGNGLVIYNMVLGNSVILYPPMFSPDEFVDAVQHYGADFLFLVPTTLRRLLNASTGPGPLFPGVRFLLTGSAPLAGAEKQAIAQRLCPNLAEFYSTTAIGKVAGLKVGELDSHADSVGRVSELLEVEIVDEFGKPVHPGETGRLRCRGPGIASGYYGDPDQSEMSEKLLDGWAYTGDLGYLDTDGYLYLAGRVDDLIIRGGENIEPSVIERELLAHPDVVEAAVVGRDDPQLGQEPVAYVVARTGTSKEDLLVYCRGRLRPNHVPVEIRLLDSLPRTTSGKIQKRKLEHDG